jgi:hypothetical protein
VTRIFSKQAVELEAVLPSCVTSLEWLCSVTSYKTFQKKT